MDALTLLRRPCLVSKSPASHLLNGRPTPLARSAARNLRPTKYSTVGMAMIMKTNTLTNSKFEFQITSLEKNIHADSTRQSARPARAA